MTTPAVVFLNASQIRTIIKANAQCRSDTTEKYKISEGTFPAGSPEKKIRYDAHVPNRLRNVTAKLKRNNMIA